MRRKRPASQGDTPPPLWVLRTAIGPALLAEELAVRSTLTQHLK